MRTQRALAVSALATAIGLLLAPPAAEAVLDKVRFKYRPEGSASSVHLAGSFNDWSATRHPMRDDDGDGTWEIEIELAPGKHQYKFVVDGSRWVEDPAAAASEEDGLGGKNSVIEVGAGASSGDGETGGAGSPFGSTKPRDEAFVGEIFMLAPDTQKLPDFKRGKPVGKIWTEVLDIAPRKFDEGFPGVSERFEWFAIRYTGTWRAPRKGLYRFRLHSDDGARLLIDGRVVIDNDGLHPPRSATREVKLDEGPYELTIEYMQGPALDVCLQLFVTEPGSTSETPIRASRPVSVSEKKKRGRP